MPTLLNTEKTSQSRETSQTNVNSRGSLNDSLAAERTVSGVDTDGLALLGLGFVVARFGLFLERLDSRCYVGAGPACLRAS